MGKQRVVIVGGDAGGMTAISQITARRDDVEIVALERTGWTSYSACGIPFVIGGEVKGGVEALVARSPAQHRERGVDLRTGHEVTAIATDTCEVEVADTERGSTYRLGYDHLLIGTGGEPVRPPLPGIDLPFVRGVHTLDDAAYLLRLAEEGCRKVVVVGSGYIGLEIAEAYLHRGCQVVVLEKGPQPLGLLDDELGAIVARSMRAHGVALHNGVDVTGFSDGVVHSSEGDHPADLVILGIGVGPNSELAKAAGLRLGPKDSISVDDRQSTSQANVWAAGDCCEKTHRITGHKTYIALGTYANRESRVAGINIGGGDARTPPVLGTAVTKLCALEIAITGLSLKVALDAGFDAVADDIRSTSRSGYFPGAEEMTVRMVAERGTGRVLGAQIVGGATSAKRIDAVAVAVTAGMDVQQVVDLDLSYAPPFSGVWDPVAVAARAMLKHV